MKHYNLQGLTDSEREAKLQELEQEWKPIFLKLKNFSKTAIAVGHNYGTLRKRLSRSEDPEIIALIRTLQRRKKNPKSTREEITRGWDMPYAERPTVCEKCNDSLLDKNGKPRRILDKELKLWICGNCYWQRNYKSRIRPGHYKERAEEILKRREQRIIE